MELSDSEKMKQLDGFKVYPSLRDHPLKTAAQWLEGRRLDDRLGGMWRVHDHLYDLSDFIHKHPGGAEWLEMTRGTDITEAFESSHINPSINKLLDKYRVGPADTERISPFTFHPEGFYSVLKRRVNTKLSSLSGESKLAARQRVIRVQNRLLASFILSFLLTAWTGSYWMAFVTGFLLFLNMNCSHNFFHQRDNWRMYGFDLGLLSSYEWRVTHALSHHGFTNSVLDFEMSDFEPWFDFRVYRKSLIQRFLPAFFIFTISQFYFFSEVVKRIIVIAIGKQKLRWENLLPVAELAALYVLTDKTSSSSAFLLWLTMQATASYAFGWVGITAAHHHPDLYHSGDGQHRFGTDWGLAQLDAVRDRNDVNGKLYKKTGFVT